MLYRPTAKLAKLLGATLDSIPEDPPLGSWFAHLVWIARRKNVMFFHAPTMYCVFVADCRKADLIPLTQVVTVSLWRTLERDGLEDQFELLAPDREQEIFAKTNNRAVLSTMVEHSFLVECWAAQERGIPRREDSAAITDYLNGVPKGALRTHWARDEVKLWAGEKQGGL